MLNADRIELSLKQLFKYLLLSLILGGGLVTFANAAATLPEQLIIEVPRPDGAEKGNVTLNLSKYSIRDPDYFKLYLDENTYPSAADTTGADTNNFKQLDSNKFPVRTYRGNVIEQPNSSVVAIVWPGDKSISIMVSEGKRILWTIDDLEIAIKSANNVEVTSSAGDFEKISKLNTRKSWDWAPSFGNKGVDIGKVNLTANIDRTNAHGWPIIPTMEEGISRVQVAVDAEPEWFAKKANNSLELALAIIEHNVNILDIVYVRDLAMSHVLTGYIQRTDTNFHVKAKDTITTWVDNGLGLNPGASNAASDKSIPFQQLIWAFVNEGNPFAYRSKRPLDGGNYSRVPLSKENADGTSHEVGHNWGGSHFVYPRDSMSGGGPWFGPTTAQKMMFLRNDKTISGGLKKITNQQFGWNVHPYATPDLVKIDIDETTILNVLANDYDGNNDAIGIAHFPKNSLHGGSLKQQGNTLVYTPKPGFQGRDSFTYLATDGKLTNDAWVQIDVGGDLLLSYNFDSLNAQVTDSSGSNLDGKFTNFASQQILTDGIKGKGLKFPWLMEKNDAKLPDTKSDDSVRPFIEIGDVVDPLDGDHSVSMWVKFDEKSLTSTMPVYLFSNSSSVIHTLVSGYNIYVDKKAASIKFELREQLSLNSTSELTPMRTLSYKPKGGIKADTWYQVTMVVDRKRQELMAYVNGAVIQPASISQVALTESSFIKGKPEGGRYISSALGINTYKPKKYGPFAGVMDEVKIYGRALSAEQIRNEWQALKPQ